jgi:hypothetical protein
MAATGGLGRGAQPEIYPICFAKWDEAGGYWSSGADGQLGRRVQLPQRGDRASQT